MGSTTIRMIGSIYIATKEDNFSAVDFRDTCNVYLCFSMNRFYSCKFMTFNSVSMLKDNAERVYVCLLF